jgi:hypothetical protein
MQVRLKKEGQQRHVQSECTTGGVLRIDGQQFMGAVSQIGESSDARLWGDIESQDTPNGKEGTIFTSVALDGEGVTQDRSGCLIEVPGSFCIKQTLTCLPHPALFCVIV